MTAGNLKGSGRPNYAGDRGRNMLYELKALIGSPVIATDGETGSSDNPLVSGASQARYTFASGGSATPPGGRRSGKSRRATPIRLSAIP